MRRYTLTIGDARKVVDVEATGTDTFRVQIDGRLVEVRLDDHRDLAHSAVTPAITPRTTPQPLPTRDDAANPAPTPSSAPVAPAASTGSAASAGSGGRDKLTAPMPGVILSIEASVGQSVARGQTLMILEAMKMKNELKSPRNGTVAEIYVAAGQQVKYGETLVRYED